MKKKLSYNSFLMMILVLFVFLYLFFFFRPTGVWWDEGVYVGMGKYLFTNGQSGLWEHIRPLFVPVVLGIFWMLNLDPLLFGKLMEFLFSLGSIIILYKIGYVLFDRRTAVFATTLFAFSSIFFSLGFHAYTEIPAIFFILLACLLFLRNHLFLSGFSLGISFLAKFPSGLFLLFILFLIFQYKSIPETAKRSLLLVGGFFVPVAPYLLFNHISYGNALLPFIDAKWVINEVLGCNVLRPQSGYYYLIMIMKENFLHLFGIVGIGAALFSKKNRNIKKWTIGIFLPLLYFSTLHCKDYRYMILFLPFLALFSGYGITLVLSKIVFLSRRYYTLLLFLIILMFSAMGTITYVISQEQPIPPEEQAYYSFLADKKIVGEIWTANPLVTLHTDAKLEKIYYPVYDATLAAAFQDKLVRDKETIQYVLLDNCGGGIICHPNDEDCLKITSDLFAYLKEEFTSVYEKTRGKCMYHIFENQDGLHFS